MMKWSTISNVCHCKGPL